MMLDVRSTLAPVDILHVCFMNEVEGPSGIPMEKSTLNFKRFWEVRLKCLAAGTADEHPRLPPHMAEQC